MNYDQRKQLIAAWIEPERGFLASFKAPNGMTGHALAEELVELVGAINDAMPILPNEESVRDYLQRLGRQVKRKARTRAWPLMSEYDEAAKALRKQPAPALGPGPVTDATHEAAVQRAAEWFGKFGQLPSWWNTRAITDSLIERGLCTWQELKDSHANVEPKGRTFSADAVLEDYRHE